MPEGPECRIITDYLTKTILNKTIINWVFCNGKYPVDYPEFTTSNYRYSM